MKQFLLVLVVTSVCLFSGSEAVAQHSQPDEVLKILGISIEGGSLSDPAAIIVNSGLRVGESITIPGDQINAAIHRLWALRIFEEIEIAVDKKISNGVYLVIKVKELPRFERIEFNGRDELSESDIMKKINLVRGQVLEANETTRIRNEIVKLYEKDGYLLAKVNVSTVPFDSLPGYQIVRVDIDEGSEVRVDHITFEGNEAFSDGALRGAMDNTSEKHWWKFWSSAKFDRKKYDDDKKLVVDFYRNNGYRDAEILSDSIWYSADKVNMNIQIAVREGALYRIRNVTWEGNSVYSQEILNDRLNVHAGEIYNAEKIEKNLRGNDAQSDVAALYLDNGYLRFNLDPQETRVAGDSIDLLIRIYEMNQFKIGHVAIKGNTKTQEKVIRGSLIQDRAIFSAGQRSCIVFVSCNS